MVRRMKHTEIGDIPADWELQTFEETFRVISNNTYPRTELNNRGGLVRNVHYGDVLTRFAEMLDCQQDDIPYINDLSLLSSTAQLLQDGDVIIADTAEDETVGKATEVFGLGEDRMVAGLHTIPCRVKKGDFAPGWLGYYMNSHMFHDQIIPFITGIKVSSISKSAIAETLIVIPPIDEQRKIIQSLQIVDCEILRLEKLLEKKALVKSGMMRNLLVGKEGDHEYVFGAVVRTASGGTPSRQIERFYTGDIPWVTTSELNNGHITKTKESISEEAISNSAAKVFPQKTILMAMYGATIGKLAIIDKPMATNQACCAMICSEKINYQWLFYKLLYWREYLISLGCGAGQPNISQAIIRDLKIRVPSIDEQITIAKVLNDVSNEILYYELKLNKYKNIKQGMMSELLTGKKRLV